MTYSTDGMEEVLELVSEMCDQRRSMFALMIAQRLVPNYAMFSETEKWGSPDLLKQKLEMAWRYLSEPTDISVEEIRASCEELEKLSPDTEKFSSRYVSSALDSVVVLQTVFSFWAGSETNLIDEAVYSITDSIELFYHPISDTRDEEIDNLTQKMILQEVANQKSDCHALLKKSLLTHEYIQELRHRWSNATPFQ